MKFLTISVFSTLFIAVVLAVDTNNTTDEPEPTTHPSSSSSATTTTTSSEPDTSTKIPTSTTTHKTTTTTQKTSTEPTTTPKTTTTEGPTSTTTTSSTTAKPAPTPEPKPSNVPQIFWNVTENENNTCIRALMKLYFEISVDGKTKYIVVDNNATDSGSSCTSPDGKERLVLTVPGEYKFTMVFVNDSNRVFANETTLEYNLDEVKGEASTNDQLFKVSADRSYLCNSETEVKMGNVTMHFEEVHVQAFIKPETKTIFGDAQECDKDDKVSDAIPIAVGVALAALIIIVLIAYLVGRRQSRQRGYQSV